MSGPTTSSLPPRSRARLSVLKKYRARGRRNYNLWLVYSPKLDADLALSSDVELVYWLYYLERDRCVVSFEVLEKKEYSDPDFLIERRNGTRQKVWLSEGVRPYEASIHGDADNSMGVWIQPSEIIKHSVEAQRYLKPIAFAAAIREAQYTAISNSLVAFEHLEKHADLRHTLSTLSNFDSAVICGVLMRHVSQGFIELDLTQASFGFNTIWRLCSDD